MLFTIAGNSDAMLSAPFSAFIFLPYGSYFVRTQRCILHVQPTIIFTHLL